MNKKTDLEWVIDKIHDIFMYILIGLVMGGVIIGALVV